MMEVIRSGSLEPSSLRGLNIGTGATEHEWLVTIDGCSFELCSATPSVLSSGQMNKKSIQLHDHVSNRPCHEIVSLKTTSVQFGSCILSIKTGVGSINGVKHVEVEARTPTQTVNHESFLIVFCLTVGPRFDSESIPTYCFESARLL